MTRNVEDKDFSTGAERFVDQTQHQNSITYISQGNQRSCRQETRTFQVQLLCTVFAMMNWAIIAREDRLYKGKTLYKWDVSPGLGTKSHNLMFVAEDTNNRF